MMPPVHEPWRREPAKKVFAHLGFQCVLKRNLAMGTWCGYVLLPPDHPWYGRRADDEQIFGINVHGGVTFVGVNDHLGLSPSPFVLGFDCNHAGDFAPALCKHVTRPHGTYRDIFYAEAEATKLAEQAEAVWVRAFRGSAKPPYWQTLADFDAAVADATKEVAAAAQQLRKAEQLKTHPTFHLSDEELAQRLRRAREGGRGTKRSKLSRDLWEPVPHRELGESPSYSLDKNILCMDRPHAQIQWDYPRIGKLHVEVWAVELCERLNRLSMKFDLIRQRKVDYAALMDALHVSTQARPGDVTLNMIEGEALQFGPSGRGTPPAHMRFIFERL